MLYEVLERQIRSLPEEALEDVSAYLDKICTIYDARKGMDFSFVDNVFGILSDEEADRLRSSTHTSYPPPRGGESRVAH